jgi:Peptidase family M28
MFKRIACRSAIFFALAAYPLMGQQKPDAAGPDKATAGWWAQTTALANDGMEGRDTGSAAYERAAVYVAKQFEGAGLKPAGDGGGYYQRVPMHQVDLDVARSSVEVVRGGAVAVPLVWSQEIAVRPQAGQSVNVEGEMVFVGYGVPSAAEAAGLKGKVAVLFGEPPADVPGAQRDAFIAKSRRALADAEVAATISIDSAVGSEPFHYPSAYSRTVAIVSDKAAAAAPTTATATAAAPTVRISSEAAAKLFAGTQGHGLAEVLLRDGEKGLPLASFPMGASLRVKIEVVEKNISAPNVIAVLPGADAKLAAEYVAVSAHLDGYGYGFPVLGDNIYNGALDDAAYVATLIELAKDLKGHAPKRSILFCVFTGEEKGLLGSAYFTGHPTVPVKDIVADLNLDQLRPLFPLKILTMEGIDDSSLGATVKTVAAKYGIEIRPDREPERSLFRRSDNYNFVRVGVPIASFIFGYDPGSPEEVIYRDWYARRYHKPQDDLQTPIDWKAAGTFNKFYGDLAVAVANAAERPVWSAGSAYRPK